MNCSNLRWQPGVDSCFLQKSLASIGAPGPGLESLTGKKVDENSCHRPMMSKETVSPSDVKGIDMKANSSLEPDERTPSRGSVKPEFSRRQCTASNQPPPRVPPSVR